MSSGCQKLESAQTIPMKYAAVILVALLMASVASAASHHHKKKKPTPTPTATQGVRLEPRDLMWLWQ
jgi:hypothetical protein